MFDFLVNQCQKKLLIKAKKWWVVVVISLSFTHHDLFKFSVIALFLSLLSRLFLLCIFLIKFLLDFSLVLVEEIVEVVLLVASSALITLFILQLSHDLLVLFLLELLATHCDLRLLLALQLFFTLPEHVFDFRLRVSHRLLFALKTISLLYLWLSSLLRVLESRDLLSNALLFASSQRSLKHLLEHADVGAVGNRDGLSPLTLDLNTRVVAIVNLSALLNSQLRSLHVTRLLLLLLLRLEGNPLMLL